MRITATFLVKQTQDKFYRILVDQDFSTDRELLAYLKAQTKPANIRADMPAEERHFSAVEEVSNKGWKEYAASLRDEAALDQDIKQALNGLTKVEAAAALDRVKAGL